MATTSHALRTFRVLAHQPVACDVVIKEPFPLHLTSEYPKGFLRAVTEDRSQQMAGSGLYVGVEFEAHDTDALKLLTRGQTLCDDLLAALALSTRIPFRECRPLQLLETTRDASTRLFAFLIPFAVERRELRVTRDDVLSAAAFFAHWHALPAGARIQRAARRYRDALGDTDDVRAFQSAYFGLEALEKPLADEAGLPAGVELVKGHCEACGAEYTRKRTALATVAKYVKGEFHGGASETGVADWKTIADLRTDLVHGLKDPSTLTGRARDALPVALHALHNASAHLSHAHELETGVYKVARGTYRQVCIGQVEAAQLTGKDEWAPLVVPQLKGWVKHPTHELVPEYNIKSSIQFGGNFFWLAKPLADATESDLLEAQFESGKEDE